MLGYSYTMGARKSRKKRRRKGGACTTITFKRARKGGKILPRSQWQTVKRCKGSHLKAHAPAKKLAKAAKSCKGLPQREFRSCVASAMHSGFGRRRRRRR